MYRGLRSVRAGQVEVAVKRAHLDRFNGIHSPPEVVERWQAQAARLHNVPHTGMAGVHEAILGATPHRAGEAVGAASEADTAYFIMQWVEGQRLDEWVGDALALTASGRLAVLENIAGALDALHDEGLVHADVKPTNILVERRRPVGASKELAIARLVDFGVLRVVSSTPPSLKVGSGGYAAPEVVDRGSYSAASDLYAFAGVALFLLSGEAP